MTDSAQYLGVHVS